jgi:hypothetical protein
MIWWLTLSASVLFIAAYSRYESRHGVQPVRAVWAAIRGRR